MLKMLTYPTTSKFGEIDRVHSLPHRGLDFATPMNTPAQSIFDGVVSQTVTGDTLLGNAVYTHTSNGLDVVYGHLNKITTAAGQSISAGDLLGYTGNTGRSTGPHIHISMLQNGQAIDPAQVINSVTSTSQQGWLGKLWHVLTTPGVGLAREEVGGRLLDLIDPGFTIVTIILILLAMMGSTKAKKGIFWAISLYILVKLIVTSL